MTSPSDIKIGKDKLEQKVIDFEKIHDYGLKQGKWDVVFITYVCFIFCEKRKFLFAAMLTVCSFSLNCSLGTNKASAGSAEAFEKIDRESVQVTDIVSLTDMIIDTLSTPRKKRGTWNWQPNALYISL